jgi:hypothetical protein
MNLKREIRGQFITTVIKRKGEILKSSAPQEGWAAQKMVIFSIYKNK